MTAKGMKISSYSMASVITLTYSIIYRISLKWNAF